MIEFIGLPYTYEEFMFENDKKNSQTIGSIFIDILQRVKGLGNEGISKIIQQYGTIKIFFDALHNIEPEFRINGFLTSVKKKRKRSKKPKTLSTLNTT